MKRLIYGMSVVCMVLLSSQAVHARLDCPTEIQNLHECEQFFEKRLIEAHPQLFQRNGATLYLQSTSGKRVELADTVLNKEESNSAVAAYYSLTEYYPDVGYALISVVYYEGQNYLLVNLETGEKTVIAGETRLSPDKQRFVAYFGDIEAGYSDNTLAVYRVDGQKLAVEYSLHPEDWGVIDAVWKTNDSIEYTRIDWVDGQIRESRHILRLSAGATLTEPTWKSDEQATTQPPTAKTSVQAPVVPVSAEREEGISTGMLLVTASLAVMVLLLVARTKRKES